MILSLPGSIVHMAQPTANNARPRLTVRNRVIKKMAAKFSVRSSEIPPRTLVVKLELSMSSCPYSEMIYHTCVTLMKLSNYELWARKEIRSKPWTIHMIVAKICTFKGE